MSKPLCHIVKIPRNDYMYDFVHGSKIGTNGTCIFREKLIFPYFLPEWGLCLACKVNKNLNVARLFPRCSYSIDKWLDEKMING